MQNLQTRRLVHLGRTYCRGNIHTIVYRDGGATYWVMNTLRDELSNETMLAIARGLRPVSQ